jgi:hypothetical protein
MRQTVLHHAGSADRSGLAIRSPSNTTDELPIRDRDESPYGLKWVRNARSFGPLAVRTVRLRCNCNRSSLACAVIEGGDRILQTAGCVIGRYREGTSGGSGCDFHLVRNKRHCSGSP